MTKNSSCGIGRLDELQNRFPGPNQLGRHGAGKVKDDSDGDRGVLGREGANLLLLVVLVDLKIFLFETGHQAVHGVGHRYRNQNQVHVHADERAGTNLQRVGAGSSRLLGTLGRCPWPWRGAGGGCTCTLLSWSSCAPARALTRPAASPKIHRHAGAAPALRLARQNGTGDGQQRSDCANAHRHDEPPRIGAILTRSIHGWRHRSRHIIVCQLRTIPARPRFGAQNRCYRWDTIDTRHARVSQCEFGIPAPKSNRFNREQALPHGPHLSFSRLALQSLRCSP